ncbi:MAG: hypothetical protein KAI66_25070 [Lentisphaeria bacterium]|nr:hypothetical protein [Lentisphaeria bacterium]
MNPDVTSLFYLRDRFTPRAKSLFFARLGLDAVGLLVMIVPSFAWVAIRQRRLDWATTPPTMSCR